MTAMSTALHDALVTSLTSPSDEWEAIGVSHHQSADGLSASTTYQLESETLGLTLVAMHEYTSGASPEDVVRLFYKGFTFDSPSAALLAAIQALGSPALSSAESDLVSFLT